MSLGDLRQLFGSQIAVATSSGITVPHQLDGLSPLHPDETPIGFDSWAEKRRREFRCGRHHARTALKDAGHPTTSIPRDLDGVPVFPPGFAGSITHTGKKSTFAAAVIAERHSVGIDAELLRELPQEMVAHVLSSRERALLGALPSSSLPRFDSEGRRALLAFSAKEAFYKCIFPRLRCRLGFHDVELRLLEGDHNGQPGQFEMLLKKGDIPGAPRALLGRFQSSDEHVICGLTWTQ